MAVRLAFLVACFAIAAACGDSTAPTVTTATGDTATTSAASADPQQESSTTVETLGIAAAPTTQPAFFLPEFTIVERTDDDVLVVAVPPGTYTDIDLQNLVGEIVELFAPVRGLHIIDDESVSQLVLATSVTDAEQASLDQHYFLRLEDGFRMVHLGPFADAGEVILGS